MPASLVAERVDGVDAGGFDGGVDSEDDADATETPKAMTTEVVVTMVFHSAVRAISQARKKPKAMPRRPPATEMRTHSVRNWRTISKRRAPMERRMPISRVRSRLWPGRCS